MSCPICQKSTEKAYRPFCSQRCANVDLGRWLNGSYAVPAEEALSDEDHGEVARNDPDIHH